MTEHDQAKYDFFLELFRRYPPEKVIKDAGPAMEEFAGILEMLSADVEGISTIVFKSKTKSVSKDWIRWGQELLRKDIERDEKLIFQDDEVGKIGTDFSKAA